MKRLIKWSILQKDNLHVFYTEEHLDWDHIFEAEYGKKTKIVLTRIEYDNFFHLVNKIYQDTTNQNMELDTLDVFYSDSEGDKITIDTDLSFFCFMKNVNESDADLVEIFIEEIVDDSLVDDFCDECGVQMDCDECQKVVKRWNSFTEELQKNLRLETSQNIKLWTPEDDKREFKKVNNYENYQIQPQEDSQWGQSFYGDQQNYSDDQNYHENVKIPQINVIKEEVEPIAAPISIPDDEESQLLYDFQQKLTIKDEVVEQPTVPFAKTDRINKNELPKLQIKNTFQNDLYTPPIPPRVAPRIPPRIPPRRAPRGYIDLDSPSMEEQNSFEAALWKKPPSIPAPVYEEINNNATKTDDFKEIDEIRTKVDHFEVASKGNVTKFDQLGAKKKENIAKIVHYEPENVAKTEDFEPEAKIGLPQDDDSDDSWEDTTKKVSFKKEYSMPRPLRN